MSGELEVWKNLMNLGNKYLKLEKSKSLGYRAIKRGIYSMKYNDLKERNIYLNQLIAFKDTEPVKVITGIRRCGKSSLLKLMQEYLLKSGVGKDQIISINFESLEFHDINYKDLYEYVKKRIPQNKKRYLFFDELQQIKQWEHAINSLNDRGYIFISMYLPDK